MTIKRENAHAAHKPGLGKGMFLLLVCTLFFAGCAKGGATQESGDASGESKVSEAEVQAAEPYTVMVYMVGSNLESQYGSASDDLMEMMESGLDLSETNVVVYTGGSSQWMLNVPNDANCVCELTESEETVTFSVVDASETLCSMGEADTLSDFLNFAYENYPAEHYALILWDHGGGPLYGFGMDELFDYDGLDYEEMRQAMEDSPFGEEQKLDWIGFDACLMASVEIANLFSDYAQYLIASEESEPGTGWDYSFLPVLNETSDPELIAQRIIDSYVESWADAWETPDLTLSCMDLSQTEPVAAAMNDLFEKMEGDLEGGSFYELASLRLDAKSFGKSSGSDYDPGYDLVDLGSLANVMEEEYGTEAKALQEVLGDLVVYQNTNVADATGVSIYYPYENESLYESFVASGLTDADEMYFSEDYVVFIDSFADCWQNGGDTSAWDTLGSMEAESIETGTPEPKETKTPEPKKTETPEPKETKTPEPKKTETPEPKETKTPEPKKTETPEPKETKTPEPSETASSAGELMLALTDEQAGTFSRAYYTILAKTEEALSNGETSYQPILVNCSITPDADGVLRVSLDQDVIVAYSGEEEDESYWGFREVEQRSDGVLYQSINTALEGPFGAMAPGGVDPTWVRVNVFAETESGEITVNSICYANSESAFGGKETVDWEKWSNIAFYKFYYVPTYDENNRILPYDQWESDSGGVVRNMQLDENFHFEKKPLQELMQTGTEFVYQITVVDCYGNWYASELASVSADSAYAQSGTYEEKADDGTYTWLLYDDHAELSSYEGTAECLEIPSEVKGLDVTVIGSYALNSNGATLKEVIVPDTVTTLRDHAFGNCSGLEKVTLPDSLTVLPASVFAYCKKLTDLKLPDSLVQIGKFAFQDCDSLKELTLPKSVTEIVPGAFYDCDVLVDLQVESGNTAYKAEDGVLFSEDSTQLIACPSLYRTTYTVPDGVEEICDFAFAGSYQEEINSISVVGYGLTEIVLPDTLVKIGDAAFYGCYRFSEITLPDSVTYIGSLAFGADEWDFTSMLGGETEKSTLSVLSLGKNVSWIGDNAFSGYTIERFEVSEDNPYYAAPDGQLTNKSGTSRVFAEE